MFLYPVIVLLLVLQYCGRFSLPLLLSPLALSFRHSQIGQISLKTRSAQLFRSMGPARTSAASPLGIVIVVIIVCCVVQINSQTSVLQVCRDSERESGGGGGAEGELRYGT